MIAVFLLWGKVIIFFYFFQSPIEKMPNRNYQIHQTFAISLPLSVYSKDDPVRHLSPPALHGKATPRDEDSSVESDCFCA